MFFKFKEKILIDTLPDIFRQNKYKKLKNINISWTNEENKDVKKSSSDFWKMKTKNFFFEFLIIFEFNIPDQNFQKNQKMKIFNKQIRK